MAEQRRVYLIFKKSGAVDFTTNKRQALSNKTAKIRYIPYRSFFGQSWDIPTLRVSSQPLRDSDRMSFD